MKIILGTKIGMTQIIGEDGVVTPVLSKPTAIAQFNWHMVRVRI